MVKHRLTKGPHSRVENGKRVSYDEGDVFEPTERELETIGDRLEPVVKPVPDENGPGDGKGGNGNDEGNEVKQDSELDDMTVEKLYKIAQDLDIDGRTKLKSDKDALVAAIEEKMAEEEASD